MSHRYLCQFRECNLFLAQLCSDKLNQTWFLKFWLPLILPQITLSQPVRFTTLKMVVLLQLPIPGPQGNKETERSEFTVHAVFKPAL